MDQKGQWSLVHLAAQKLAKHRKKLSNLNCDLVYSGYVIWISLIGFKATNSES